MKIRAIIIAAICCTSIIAAFSYAMFSFTNPKPNPMQTKSGKDYKTEWKTIDSLINKGLPQSALAETEKLYIRVKTEGNTPQIVKTIIYKARLTDMREEDSYIKIFKLVEDEIKTAKAPLSNILYSVQAELFWRYYTSNRYRFMERSTTIDFKNDDIATWDLTTLVSKVSQSYLKSLENPALLQKENINSYLSILSYNDNINTALRPTLYDFLVHRAIDFFSNEESAVSKPVDAFKIDNSQYLGLPSEFVKLSFNTNDSLSFAFHALAILQQATAFHLKDAEPDALIDLDLKRLNYVQRNATFEEKDTLYFKALAQLENTYSKYAASAEVSFLIANQLYSRGQKHEPLQSEDYKWDIKTALEKCNDVIESWPKTDGAANCRNLADRIRSSSIALTFEKYVPSGKPFPGMVAYTNVKNTYLRIIPADYNKLREDRNKYKSQKEMVSDFIKMKYDKQLTFNMPDDNDYQKHSSEIAIPELTKGYYVLLASDNSEFSFDKGDVAYSFVTVTDLSYITRRNNEGAYHIFVLNRTNGRPIHNATIQTYTEEYNNSKRTYETKKWKTFLTNAEGFVEIPADKRDDYRSFMIEITHQGDFIASNRDFYQYYYYENDNKPVTNTFFFTDRAIYRPGQTVYFKGLMIETKGEEKNIKAGQATTVTFYDVNHQEISKVNLITNEYGTFSGSFTAPQGVLTGTMHIGDKFGSKYFNVEEYKRPKFEAKFEPVKGLYKLDEKIKTTGKATAYAGSSIDNAEVKYRVVRNTRYPYFIWGWRWGFPTSPEVVITTGTTKTDATGAFNVEFAAVPDKKVDKKFKPVFTYTIYADITDINGETRSTQTTLSVGYTAMLIDMYVPDGIDKSAFTPFNLSTTNLNGEKEIAECQIKIARLINPEKPFRTKLWARTDKKIIPETEYRNLFPNDLYDNENDVSTWAKEKPVFEKSFTTDKDKATEVDINNIGKWKSGKYIIEIASKDAFGESINKTYYFTLTGPDDKTTPLNDMFWVYFPSKEYEPGDKAQFSIGSAETDVNVIYEIEHKGQIIKREWVQLNNDIKTFTIPIEEKHRGNFAVHFAFVKNNRVYTRTESVTVTHSNKYLDIVFETFRDKLLPGETEEWKITIKDKKGDKMLAEMMAGMYDASLDAFARNYWHFSILSYNYSQYYWDNNKAFRTENATIYTQLQKIKHQSVYRSYPALNWFGFYFYGWGGGGYYDNYDGDMLMAVSETVTTGDRRNQRAPSAKAEGRAAEADQSVLEDGIMADEEASGGLKEAGEKSDKNAETRNGIDAMTDMSAAGVQVRTNFNETAFFYPHLRTNENGELVISFTVPESLTKWRILTFAHTKDLKTGTLEKELVTQKDLMVMPNPPRFLRENDKISFSAKVSNLSDKELNGTAQLQLFDAITMQPIDNELQNTTPVINFTVKAGESTPLNWNIFIKEGTQAVTYRIIARAGNFSDGEEMAIPVLTNRMLVTESLPLPIRGKSEKTFSFTKLINSGQSNTLKHHKLTLEFTSNPAWYAIQALPYLIEYPYDCNEQIFSRFYANSIASHIANSNPRIKRVFDSWLQSTPDALLSNLEKNQELKSVLLEETPWVLQGKNESERKKRIALLFDLNKMANEKERALQKLLQNQMSNGGWSWFKGMPDDRYITQHIVQGLGKLNKLGIEKWENNSKLRKALIDAVEYIDNRMREDYEHIKKHNEANMHKDHLYGFNIHYLYTRSFYTNIEVKKNNKTAFDYFFGQAKKYWNNKTRYYQGMIALALNRYNETAVPADIVKSLTENALTSDEMGMYWKDNTGGYYWYEAPIETQALLIEVYDEVAKDVKKVDELKIWLLKQKQTQDWKTTKATAEAIYALILRGTDFLASDKLVEVSLGEMVVDPRKIEDVKVEAGTGYFKTSWAGSSIKPAMGNVKVTKTDDGVAWGALYWQYFEQLDKITPAETPLKLNKKLFTEISTPSGQVIKPVNEGDKLKVGDKLIVRIELRVDRDMEYIHMKDMRASGFEPVNVISQYKYQDGLGYYESTRDAATHFFISYLRRGTYVFEYPMFVSHKGDFSNGITTIQCMYAPEFASHSEGIRVTVE